MGDYNTSIDDAIAGLNRLRRSVARNTTKQVQSADEKELTKATALSWFNSNRPTIEKYCGGDVLGGVDQGFGLLLEFSDRATSRERYKSIIKDLKKDLVKLRTTILRSGAVVPPSASQVSDPPAFDQLVSDPQMQQILTRRWYETQRCLSVDACLSATVMLGALLEALLLARINREVDKTKIFGAKGAPKDKTGTSLPLQQWTLRNYIDVAHELSWIRQSARDVGVVLRDYRNYIHPAKELSHGIEINTDDAKMFWLIFNSLAAQIITAT